MNTWQEWVTLAIGFIVATISMFVKGDRDRSARFIEDTNNKMMELSERITRVESEIVTEREVREVLHELIGPFTTQLAKIEDKTETIGSDITAIRVAMATLAGKGEE